MSFDRRRDREVGHARSHGVLLDDPSRNQKCERRVSAPSDEKAFYDAAVVAP